MRIVVVGATGNVGTSVLEALARDDAVQSVLGLARRHTGATYAKTEFAAADVTRDDLVPHFRGADCVVHLAWLIQPSRDRRTLWETNVEGSSRVLAAVAAELGWAPARDGIETIRELLLGLADRAGGRTPPLRAGDRTAELAAGFGGKSV